MLMSRWKKKFAITMAASAFAVASFAANFTVRHINIQGLHHIQASTVLHYLPIHVGQQFTDAKGEAAIVALYKTGFFSNVALSKAGDTLLVSVAEQPAIGYLNINGAGDVADKQMALIKQKTGVAVGKIYNSANLNELMQALKAVYQQKGYFHAEVDQAVKHLHNNMVAVNVNVVPGDIAKVKAIRFIGNHVFSDHTLESKMALATPSIISWFTDSDKYSKYKMSESIQNITNFYLNNGYLKFNIISQKAEVSSELKGMVITIQLHEGAQYTINGFSLPLGLRQETINKISAVINPLLHKYFSRQKVMDANDKIASILGDEGYAFPGVSAVPKVDDVHHTISLAYQIQRGHQVYINHIVFDGNHETTQAVLRKSIPLMEGEIYSTAKVNESKRRLANLPYLRNITVEKTPVAGHPNEVNLIYHVHEVSAGQAQIMGGYSDLEGFLYGANLSQANFLGTGKYFGISFQRSQYAQSYSINYNNPFYSIYGLSRGFSISYTKTTPGAVNLSTYTEDSLQASVNYSMPVSEYNSITFGYGYDYNHIRTDADSTPTAIINYLDNVAKTRTFTQGMLTAGWTYSSLDQYIFPTSGLTQDLSATLYPPLNKRNYAYYKAQYNANWYLALNRAHSYVLEFKGIAGYGNSVGDTKGLPFFENFYAGGISTVPGYTANTLGPTSTDANGDASSMGGNVELVGGASLIFPNPISSSLRTALTFSAGNVFDRHVTLKGDDGLRYSAGLLIAWRSPLGPLDFSFAKALNKKPGDDTSIFQFTFGTSL